MLILNSKMTHLLHFGHNKSFVSKLPLLPNFSCISLDVISEKNEEKIYKKVKRVDIGPKYHSFTPFPAKLSFCDNNEPI